MSLLSAAAGVALIAAGLVCILVPLAVHFGFRAPRLREQGTPGGLGLGYRALSISTRRGRRLFAWLIPGGSARTLVLLHGWGSNAEQMLPLAAPLCRAGLNLLLMDARNHGRSDSDTFSSLPRFAEDLEHALDWLRAEQPALAAQQLAVAGHSVGAGAVLLAATRHPAIDAAISIAAFAHPAEVTARFLAHLPLPRLAVTLVARYVEWLIGCRFDAIAPMHTIARVRCPVLLVHGSADRTVPLDDARRILANRGSEAVRLLEVPDARHDSVDQVEAHAGELVAFLDRCLAAVPAHGGEAQARLQRSPALHHA